jgi:hypothetical protein
MNAVPEPIEHAVSAVALIGAQHGIAPQPRVAAAQDGRGGDQPCGRGCRHTIGAVLARAAIAADGQHVVRNIPRVGDLADRGENVGNLAGVEDSAAAHLRIDTRHGGLGRHSRQLFGYAHTALPISPESQISGENVTGPAKQTGKILPAPRPVACGRR